MTDMSPADILVIDDDSGIVYTLTSLFESMGHQVSASSDLKQGYELLSTKTFDLLFLDVQLPDGSGLNFLSDVQTLSDPPIVIVMTGFADPEGAEQAIRNGAWDYLEKPLSLQKISLQMIRALQYREEKSQAGTPVMMKRKDIIGDSREIQAALSIAARAANTDANVLIQGETGTGKELFARAIHENSHRHNANFVVVDCGIMTETLVESMLFGHVKGAFTGAAKEQAGIVQLADGGTLFLDEIGDLPQTAQSSFLRVLQERRFRPVGGKKEIHSNFRLIAATNKDLDTMAAQNSFRPDLLFRLKAVNLELPALKNRKSDIKAQALHYIERLCNKYTLPVKGFSPDFMEALQAYSWPGNTRELVHALDSAIAMAQAEPMLFPLHLPRQVRIALARGAFEKTPSPVASTDKVSGKFAAPRVEPGAPVPLLKDMIEKCEKDYFTHLLTATGGDIKSMCRICGLSRAMVYARLKKYNLSRTS